MFSMFYEHIGSLFLMIRRSKSAFNSVVLCENILISTEWKEIKLQNSLMFENRNKHMLSINLDKRFEGDFLNKGIKMPSGEIVTPEVKLVDAEGNEYQFHYNGFLGRTKINFASQEHLPKDKIYDKVRVKCHLPVKAEEVLWIYYNPKDLR